jgi:hypothetical protein
MTLLSQLAALLAIMSTGIVYGTDVFCALVQRSALARVDDATLTAIMGNVHRFADAHETPANARTLQQDWDRIIGPRAVLQGLAVLALGVSLIS